MGHIGLLQVRFAYLKIFFGVEQRAEFYQLLFHERSNGVEQKRYEREERQKELAPKKLERIQPWELRVRDTTQLDWRLNSQKD